MLPTARRLLGVQLLLLSLSAFHPTTQAAQRQIVVLNAPSSTWREEVLHSITRVNRFLGAEFSVLPHSVRIVRSHTSPEYDLSLKLLLLDELFTPVELYHEYAHSILDRIIFEHSSALRYFELRNEIHQQDIESKITQLVTELEDDKAYLRELKLKGYQDMVANLSAAIEQSQQLLLRLEAARESNDRLAKFYPRYNGDTPYPGLYELIGPYHELFADTMAALITKRWNAVQMAQVKRLRRNNTVLSFVNIHPEITTEQFLAYRAFIPGIELASYKFSALEQKSDYTQFSPMRSYIRAQMEAPNACHPARFLYALAVEIAAEVELRLTSEQHYTLSLFQQNQRLIQRLSRLSCGE